MYNSQFKRTSACKIQFTASLYKWHIWTHYTFIWARQCQRQLNNISTFIKHVHYSHHVQHSHIIWYYLQTIQGDTDGGHDTKVSIHMLKPIFLHSNYDTNSIYEINKKIIITIGNEGLLNNSEEEANDFNSRLNAQQIQYFAIHPSSTYTKINQWLHQTLSVLGDRRSFLREQRKQRDKAENKRGAIREDTETHTHFLASTNYAIIRFITYSFCEKEPQIQLTPHQSLYHFNIFLFNLNEIKDK